MKDELYKTREESLGRLERLSQIQAILDAWMSGEETSERAALVSIAVVLDHWWRQKGRL